MSRKVEIPFTIRFITPAVLGGAGQGGECCATSFEQLLRKWWRCVEMGRSRKSGAEPNAQELRRREESVFGSAQATQPRPSKVEIVFEESDSPIIEWAEGTIQNPASPDEPEDEGEFDQGRSAVDSMMRSLFPGLVPLESYRQSERKKRGANEIEAGETLRAIIRCPKELVADMSTVLSLIHWLGTNDGQDLDGQGSLDILREDGEPWCPREVSALKPIERPWKACLNLDQPNAIGIEPARDRESKRLLLWRTKQGHDSWREAWHDLRSNIESLLVHLDSEDIVACLIEAASKASQGKTPSPPDIHRGWGRFAMQLGGKVVKERLGREGEAQYYGVLFHMPYRLRSDHLDSGPTAEDFFDHDQERWERLHRELDLLMHRWTSP